MQQQHRFSHWVSSSLALLLCLMVGLALPVRPVQAATISVTNTNDSGPGSLRQAIADAAPGDTITFALPNPSTITLSSELVIAKNLTITGPGAAALTISGNNATRVFFINPGAVGATSGPPATALTVQITNLTIANGRAQGGAGGEKSNAGGSGGAAGMGGAIFTNNGNLTISGVIFRANQAQGGNGAGGGESFFGAAGGGGVGGNGGEGVFAGGAGGSGGALGGNGGAGGAAGIFLPPGSNGGAGAAGGEGAGGGGGGIGGDCPQDELGRCTGPGANGGNGGSGGFGGGGGGGGSSGRDVGSAIGGNGGNGGFGGGGGGGGGNQGVGASSAGGVGGSFGGNGSSSSRSRGGSGGGGAGLGGAIFVRAGSLTLVDSSLIDNRAAGGSGAQNGQGKGGALFILTPATLHLSGCITFSGNSATDAAGSANDTHDRYGSVASTPPCDSTGPVITPNVVGTLGSNGWYTSDVTVSWTVVDNESTISSQSGCEVQNVTSDTAGVTFTCSATSEGGSSSQSVTIKRDATAPTISAAASSGPNGNGWYNSNVTVQFTCADNLSGVTSCPADEILSSEGAAIASTTQTITDLAGNSSAASNVITVQIDKTAPTISAAATTQPNANGWYNSDVTVRFTCADGLSGVASCPADETLSSEGAAVASTAQTVTDLAGNSSATSNVVTVQIDKTAPIVTVTGVSNGASYILGSAPVAGCSTSDALSGVATQATISVTGGNPDGTGSFTATCSGATDNAGNNGSASATYSVIYNWTGFFQPVDNLPTVNTVNAGQAIPVKFSLGGNYGLNIFATGYPASQQVSCGGSGGGSTSPIEETVTAGNSSLQYDPGTQRYSYVWKTDKAWAGTCRQLIVKLIDGTEHTAFFQFNGNGRSAGGSDTEGDAAVVRQQLFLPLVNN